MTLLTFIIPTFNAMGFINYTLLNLVKQTNKNFDIVFVDDCSSDGTPEFLRTIFAGNENVVVTCNSSNKGPSGTRNEGIRFVKTPYFTFLDPDDSISINYVDSLLHALEKFPETPIYANTVHTRNILQTMQSPECLNTKRSSMVEKTWVPTDINRLVFCTKVVLQHHIKFDEGLRNFEGELFCLKYFDCLDSQNIIILNESFHVHYHRDGSLTKTDTARFEDSLPILEKYRNSFKDVASNQKVEYWLQQTKKWIAETITK